LAKRTISTRLAIEGEAQYKQTIAAINAELRNHKSALDLVQSQYKNNANSMEALQAKQKALSDLQATQTNKVKELNAAHQNAQKAVDAYAGKVEDLTNEISENKAVLSGLDDATRKSGEQWAKYATSIEQNERKLTVLKKSTGDTTEEQQKLEEKISKARAAMEAIEKSTDGAAKSTGELIIETDKLKRELEENEAKLAAAEKGANNWKTSLNKAQVELNNTNDELQKNEKHLEEASKSADKCAISIDRFGKETEEATKKSQHFGEQSVEALDSLSSVLASAGIVQALKKITNAFVACAEASMTFESAMTGVEKTTDLTDRELGKMADAFKELSATIPLTAAEIAGIAENAGQLGIAKENIVDFTATMADLGVATNLSGEEAAQAFAKFANVTGMAQTDFKRLGSAVVALGNNMATTEADITAMAQRLASAGKLAGLTEPEILALAASMSSVGIEAEAGGTAMTQTLGAIEKAVASGGEKLEQFARVAGVSSDEFSRKWKTSPVEAIQLFIRGLGNLEKQGENATVVLDEMGLSGIRQSNMLKSLSLASDNVAAAVDLSNKAWVENTALTKEAELRYSTTESRLKLLNNSLDRLKITIGNQLNPVLSKLINAGTDVLDWVNDFLESNDAAVPIIAAVTVALGVMVAGITAMTLAATVGTKALVAFKAALDTATGGITFIITIIGAAVAALATLALSFDDGITKANELSEAALGLSDSLEEINRTLEDNLKDNETAAIMANGYAKRLKELEAQGLKTNAQQEEYRRIVELINEVMPELNAQIDEQTGLIKGGTDALIDNIEALKQKYILEAYQEKYHTLLKEEAEITVDLTDVQRKLTAEKENASRLDAERTQILDAINKRTDELNENAKKLTEETGILTLANTELDAELNDLYAQLIDVNDEIAISSEQTKEYEKAITNNQNALDALEQELAFAEEGYRGLLDAQNAATEQAPEFTESQQIIIDSLDAGRQALETIAAAHEAAWWAARDSIDSQIGKWEEMDNKTTISAKKVINALQSQITFMANYTDNMTRLTDRNINELARLSGMSVSETKKGMDGLVASLSDGSVKSAQILAGLATASDEEIANIILSMKGVEKGKDAWATSVTGMDESTKAALDSITAKLDALEQDMDKYDEAARAARHTADGYIETLRKKIPAMRQMGEKLGRAVTSGYNSAAKVKSPSQVAMKSAEDTVAGYLVGYEKKINDMEKAGEKLARAISNSYTETMKEIALYSRPQNVLVLPTAANNATASQAPSKSVVYNFNSPKALSMREIRLEMIATQQRERLMEV
jgi:TP901 family phage tail tape measure protein